MRSRYSPTEYAVRDRIPVGTNFPHPSTPALAPGSFPEVKWSGRGFNHPPPSSAEVKKGVDLYF
jgi:hypothetical protein